MSALRAEEETETEEIEDLESFRRRARAFITANLAPKSMEEMRLDYSVGDEESELAEVAHERELQRMLFDGGLGRASASPGPTAARGSRPRTRGCSTRRSWGTTSRGGSRCRRSCRAPR